MILMLFALYLWLEVLTCLGGVILGEWLGLVGKELIIKADACM